MLGTPATRAGIVHISAVDGYAARPPGTYAPTRASGVVLTPRVIPGSTSVSQRPWGRWSSWNAVIRASAATRASVSRLSTDSKAASRSSSVTVSASSSTWSSSRARSRRAWSPWLLTRSMIAAAASRAPAREERRPATQPSISIARHMPDPVDRTGKKGMPGA
ncbi:hypothetical protein DSECCO2_369980 [anaerobic digester metagenome]